MNTLIKPIEILLIEDNPGDVRLTQECLKKSKVANHLSVAEDGIEAMSFLFRKGRFVDAPRPDLILLDLNLPRKDGREILGEIKRDENLHRIPVVVLTSSDSESDIFLSYNFHANCYITKPILFEEFTKVIIAIENFWLSLVRLPERVP
jgi:two-component system, chemotaxis family, response regulator Rcp1